MLPIPFKKYTPKIFQEDSKTDSLANKIDSNLEQWKQDILDLKKMSRPDQCAPALLSELSFLLNAGIVGNDSETQRRQKVASAVFRQRYSGSFNLDVKIIIDTILGYDSRVLHQPDTDEWALMGGNESIQTKAYYRSTMGVDGVDLSLGLWLFGSGTEINTEGNISINLHYGIYTAVLTPAQILAVRQAIENDVLPAYFRVYIGYIDSVGKFNIYDTIG